MVMDSQHPQPSMYDLPELELLQEHGACSDAASHKVVTSMMSNCSYMHIMRHGRLTTLLPASWEYIPKTMTDARW